MLLSLVQTLVCVLLINGGLYALHLKGNTGNGNPGNNGQGGDAVLVSGISSSQLQHNNPTGVLNILTAGHNPAQHPPNGFKQTASAYDSASRLNEELADLAQLERERLMLLGIAKQTAAANAAAATGHHGRPIITGRVQMSPIEDGVGIEGDYAGMLLQPPPRGYMFGHVVKQAREENDELDRAEEFAGGGNNRMHQRAPVKYEYGRLVQPPTAAEYEPHQLPLDLDAFMELDPEPETDDDDFDLEGYQYLDELLAEQQRQWEEPVGPPGMYQHAAQRVHRPNNPYQTLEELEAGSPLALRELFNKEQHEAALKQKQEDIGAATRNAYNGNIRLQQKWQRKRAQQNLQRNIFDQKKHTTHHDVQLIPPQTHHFNQRYHATLALANSEATATKSLEQPNENLRSATDIHNNQHDQPQRQQQQQQQSQSEKPQTSALAVAAKNERTAVDANQDTQHHHQQQQQQQQQEQNESPMHPNHKRSGVLGSVGSHSIASQLMLRTARGQRQYDVPQIGKSTFFSLHAISCPI